MTPATNNSKGKSKAEAPVKVKLTLKVTEPTDNNAPAKVKAPKVCNEMFLLTLLNTLKVDYQSAADILGIEKAACRMRVTRLQQKYGFKKTGTKGTPRGKKGVTKTRQVQKASKQ
ncbi:unnamed protein product [Penicillium glandicola]